MRKWLAKLSRKSLILLAILALLTCSGVAYGANQIVVHFGGGVGVTGSIKIIAPNPTIADLVVVSTPQFTVTAGATDMQTGNIVVQNNSAYDLHLDSVIMVLSNPALGILSWNSVATNATLKAHMTHNIVVAFIPDGSATVGDYEYSGDLTYSW